MSIIVYPYKLTRKVLEARLPPGLSVSPGQWLRFEGNPPFYGQIREVFLMPSGVAGMPETYGTRIDLPEGCPDLSPRQAVLLTPETLAREATRLQEPLAYPLRLSEDLTCELERLGALTLIAGGDLPTRLEALRMLIQSLQAHRKIFILDPLGLPTPLNGAAHEAVVWKAGRDARMSLRSVGDRRLLDAFGALFPEHLRETVLRVIADHLPVMGDFTPFQTLMNLEAAVNLPLKNLILQHYHAVARSGAFANTPEQVFQPSRLPLHQAATVDLSDLPPPWKGLFYEQALQACLGDAEGIPALICPERCLSDTADWVRKAEVMGASLIILASSRPDSALQGMADNLILVENDGKIQIQGKMTHGLPVRLPLPVASPLQLSGADARPASLPEGTPTFPSSAFPTPAPGFNPASPLTESSPEKAGEEPEALSGIPAGATEAWDKPDGLPLTWSVSPHPSAPRESARQAEERTDFPPVFHHPDKHEVAPPESHESPSANASLEAALFAASGTPSEPPTEYHPEPVSNIAEMNENALSEVLPEFSGMADATDFLTPESLHEIMASDMISDENTADENTKEAEEEAIADNIKEELKQTEVKKAEEKAAEEGEAAEKSAEEPASPVDAARHPGPSDEPQSDTKAEEVPAANESEISPEISPTGPSDSHIPEPEPEQEPEKPLAETPEKSLPEETPEEETPVAEQEIPFPSTPEPEDAIAAFSGEENNIIEEVAPEFSFPELTDSEPTSAVTLPEISAYEEFSFDLEPKAASESGDGNGRGNLSSWGPSAVRPSTELADDEMQEALDLIFPPYPDRASFPQGPGRPVETQSHPDEPDEDEDKVPEEKEDTPEEVPAPEPESIPVLESRTTETANLLNPSSFQVGDRVTHPTYGAGVVQRMIPMENSIILNITFDRVGKRLLDPALCPALHPEPRPQSQAG